jgi:hypothetical protein
VFIACPPEHPNIWVPESGTTDSAGTIGSSHALNDYFPAVYRL